ncbi:hypothetical protein CK203_013264 [Vitis vinifera]|uniref:Reverse transcriptase domain-containing protein n=1 Tax=Vitis vinifera TaxID=29760 RepID=A0A438JPS7_VITVI|nr:hypothetical protein CK203_013264 [Vitis vinifera]
MWRPSCNGLTIDALGGDDATMLEAPFFDEEVFSALSILSGDKAPSPDSFPMKGAVEDLKDFRPISMVGSLYKLAKVLANGLKKVVGKVVSLSQNAFVERRKVWMLL